jgi:hypothetical protein
MASHVQHLAQAQHNEAFLSTFNLGTSPYLDWAVTAAFYTALHYLRALMAKQGYTNISSYGDMDKAFDRLSVLKQSLAVHDAYRQLKDDSRDARYNMWKPSGADIVDAQGEMLKVRDFVLPNL